MTTRACSRDMIIAQCDEAARKREARRGKPPRQFMVIACALLRSSHGHPIIFRGFVL